MKNIVSTDKAPKAIGPYSQAVIINNMLFASGQIPINPKSGNIESNDIVSQTKQVLENIVAIVTEAGFAMTDVVKTTVFMADMSDFAAMNEVYASYFTEKQPARSAVAVKSLPKNALIEIEIVAAK